MKKLLFILILCSLQLSAQKEANFWYFGENAGLDFSSNTVKALTDGKLITDEGSTSISDKDGNLLFYTDGTIVYNRNHEVLSNGEGLLGDASSAQSAIVVPLPKSDNIYYIFTVGEQNPDKNNGVAYSILDISLNNGLGEITSKNNLLKGFSEAREQITSVSGSECDTFWVITSDFFNFYAYKVDSSGISNNPVISSRTQLSNLRGYLKLSPDGKKLASATQVDGCFLYDFNDTTGMVTNEQIINIPFSGNTPLTYGVEFSQNSSKLYVSTGVLSQILGNGSRRSPENASIFQIDISLNDITDINSSVREIYRTNSGYRGALQLAPDGKIYYARSRTNYLGVINFPENNANEVNFIEEGIFLETGLSTEGLPPFIQSFFASVNLIDKNNPSLIVSNNIQEICEEDQLDIEPDIPTNLTNANFSWKKENDDTFEFTTRELSINKNLGSGVYLFNATATDECNRVQTYSGSVEVIFVDLPIVNTLPTIEQCDFDDIPNDFRTNFNLKILEDKIYTGTEDVTIEFFEENDISFSSPINKENYTNAQPTINSNHKLVVKVTNTNGPQCSETGLIELKVNPSGIADYDDFYVTEYDGNSNISNSVKSEGTNTALVNFDEKTTTIINDSNGALNTTDYNFNYYLSASDAALQINEIIPPFEEFYEDNTSIFVRISLKNSGACESVGQFKIILNELPEPQGNETPILLCVNNPIDNPQLFTVELNANTGNTDDTYKWYLNGEEILNENNAILNANKEGTYKVEAIRNFENDPNKINDDTSTIGFNTFTVFESNPPVITTISFNNNVDNQSENIITVNVQGKGDYEFAINSSDLIDFVKGDDNFTYTFTNVSPGINQIYIRDRNNCGTMIASEPVPILNFQKFFTPNNDAKFDTWEVLGTNNNFYQSVNYQIFDRFGKLLANKNQKIHGGWNGNFNGQPLPTDDYWYTVILIDINGKITQKTGHFSLIRD